MSKFLVVFYSHTGASRQVAKSLSQMQSWELVEVMDRVPRTGWPGTLRCMLDSMLHRRPDIVVPTVQWNQCDAVVLVSPIWAYRLAGPMRTFISQNRQALPDVAVISVMGSGGAANAVSEVEELIGHAPLMSTAFTSDEVSDGSFTSRLDAFGTALRHARGGIPEQRPAMPSAAHG